VEFDRWRTILPRLYGFGVGLRKEMAKKMEGRDHMAPAPIATPGWPSCYLSLSPRPGSGLGISPVSVNLSMIIDSPRNSGVRLTLRSIELADIV